MENGKKNKEELTPQSAPTLRDIAAATGMGLSTVSYALNNHPRVSKETRELIQKKAAEMGYTQRPLVRSLMKQIRHGKVLHYKQTIAFLTGFREKDEWKKYPFILDQFEHVQQTAESYGYKIEPFWLLDPEMNPSRLAQVLTSRGIQAVIVSPLFEIMEVNEFPWSQFHSITIGHSLVHPAMHRGTADLIQIVHLALQKVFDAGCRSPLLIISDILDRKTLRQFSIGWRHYIKEIFELPDERIIHADKIPPIKSELFKIIHQKKVDVIIGGNILNPLEEIGLKIPEEIGYVALNRQDDNVTGISQQWNHIAAAAAQFLIAQIESNKSPGLPNVPVMVSTPPAWHDGPTLRTVGAC